MGYRNREIECKLKVDCSYKQAQSVVDSFISKKFPEDRIEKISGAAFDLYWPLKGQEADFVRLRKHSGDEAIITCKDSKTGIFDRMEIDLPVANYKQAKALMLATYGKEPQRLEKKYFVWFIDDEFTNISVYRMGEDGSVFVEIEGKTKKFVNDLVAELSTKFEFDHWRVSSSLFEMFIQKKKPVMEKL